MEQSDKNRLDAKKRVLQLKLAANYFFDRKIRFHWIDVLEWINQSGLSYTIEHLCSVTEEEYPFIVEELHAYNHPLLNTSMIRIAEETLMDTFFTRFPSTEVLKYDINLPLISGSYNLKNVFSQANELLTVGDSPMFLISPEWSPMMKISWHDMIEKNLYEFCETPCTIIFTDIHCRKVLFKSIEDEWRCSTDKQ